MSSWTTRDAITRNWSGPGWRIKLRFAPTCCPRLNPIERSWELMHEHVTRNKRRAAFRDFSTATLTFLRGSVTGNWRAYRGQVTGNFRVINPAKYRIIVRAGDIKGLFIHSNRVPAAHWPCHRPPPVLTAKEFFTRNRVIPDGPLAASFRETHRPWPRS